MTLTTDTMYFALSVGLHLTLLSTRTARALSSSSAAYQKLRQINEQHNDAYRYLEDVDSEESLKFAKEQNEKCLEMLGDPEKSDIYSKVLKVLQNNDRIPYVTAYGMTMSSSTASAEDKLMYNFWRDEKNTKGLWRRTSLSSYMNNAADWEVLLDVDELAKKDNVSWVYKGSIGLPMARDDNDKNDNGRVVTRALVKLSDGGADAVHIREMCLINKSFVDELDGSETGFQLPEAKTRAVYKSRDVLFVGSDFGPGSMTNSGYPRTVREWVRGTDIKDAPIIFEGEMTDVSVTASIDDERKRGGYLLELHERSISFYTGRTRVRKLEPEHLLAPNDPRKQGISEPPEFTWLDIQDDAKLDFFSKLMVLILRSDWNIGGKIYKSGSVIYTDFDSFLAEGKENCSFSILFEPTENTALDNGYTSTKNYIILHLIEDVKAKIVLMKFDPITQSFSVAGGDDEAKICDASLWSVDKTEDDTVWAEISGYTQPPSLYLTNLESVRENTTDKLSKEGKKVKSLPEQFDANDLEVKQGFAPSKDGTLVPYFIIMKKGIKLNGNTPTLLYGYGGFEISMTPRYSPAQGVCWLERGGVYVEANIRGGGEYGPKWHQAALKENRNKSYEDFIAVGEDLCKKGICKPSTLGIRGGSNGGLLMGMMLTLRPDLFGAIHCAVPLLDMERFHLLLAGASWMAEYGNPDDDFENFLHQYSPFHLIDPDVNYPPFLVTTSTRDDRVHPAHARKMVKKMNDLGKGKWPVYYYENMEGGHGGAADSKQQAFMSALAYDFLWDTLMKGCDEN